MEAHRDRGGLAVRRAVLDHREGRRPRVRTVAPSDVRVGRLDVGALCGRERQLRPDLEDAAVAAALVLVAAGDLGGRAGIAPVRPERLGAVRSPRRYSARRGRRSHGRRSNREAAGSRQGESGGNHLLLHAKFQDVSLIELVGLPVGSDLAHKQQ